MAGDESASANDDTLAVRDTAGGSKNRTITGAINGLFREAVKVLTRRAEDEEPPRERRRGGDTEGAFQRLARKVARRFDARQSFRRRAAITSRYIALAAEARAGAARHVADTPNAFNQWNNDDIGANFDESFEAGQNCRSLDL